MTREAMTLGSLSDELFSLSSDIRYVALRRRDALESRQRPGIAEASASDSDRYEELIVNPTLLTLLAQRGQIDCGGLEYVIVRYGNFFQLVHPVEDGHVSIAIEPHGDPVGMVASVREILAERQLWSAE